MQTRWAHVIVPQSPLWPLPGDYAALTTEGRQLARRNACLNVETTQDAVRSWMYFCRQYLMPDYAQGFDPMFYHPPVRDFGFIHPLIVAGIHGHVQSCIAMPRGSAKTTTLHAYFLWLMHIAVQYRIRLYKAGDGQVVGEVRALRDQFEGNSRLIDDFGNLVPNRNEGIWSHHTIRTAGTKCSLAVESVWGQRQRGGRGDKIVLDDVEFDPDNPMTSDNDVERLKTRVFKVLLPMMESGASLAILGTKIHCRSLLNSISLPDKLAPDRDPRFRDALWYKLDVPYRVVHEGKPILAWSKFDDTFTAQKRATMGDAEFAAEYESSPMSAEETPFTIVPEHHEYTVTGDTELLLEQPFGQHDDVVVNYGECSGVGDLRLVGRSVPWSEFLRGLYRFITVDYAYTSKKTSDWCVVHVLGADHRNDLWSLDLWRGQVKFPALVGKVWELALRWQAQCLGVEAYPVQEQYFEDVAAFGEKVIATYGYFPSLKKISPPIDKGTRILRLTWRFERGKIKLPADRRLVQPYFSLYQQIRLFTQDLANLAHDDEIDTLSMSSDVLGGRVRATPVKNDVRTVLERMEAGETVSEFGLPLIDALPLEAIPGKILRRLADQNRPSLPEPAAVDADPAAQFAEAGPCDPFDSGGW